MERALELIQADNRASMPWAGRPSAPLLDSRHAGNRSAVVGQNGQNRRKPMEHGVSAVPVCRDIPGQNSFVPDKTPRALGRCVSAANARPPAAQESLRCR
jgi:hypothetical protein